MKLNLAPIIHISYMLNTLPSAESKVWNIEDGVFRGAQKIQHGQQRYPSLIVISTRNANDFIPVTFKKY